MTEIKFNLIWPLVFLVTGIFYLLIIVNLPFNQLRSTIFLFALVAFWSRLPGVAMPSPLYIFYFADIIDFFSIIIVVNVSPMAGATFSLVLNLVTRLCGSTPRWDIVLKDTACQFVACLLIPFILPFTKDNLELTMIIYTVIRCLLYFPLHWIPDGVPFIEFLLYEMIAASFAMIIVNIIYARYLGAFFDVLLKQGIAFNWWLFIAVTIGIKFSKDKMFGKSENRFVLKFLRGIKRKFKSKKENLNQLEDNMFFMESVKDKVQYYHVPNRDYSFR